MSEFPLNLPIKPDSSTIESHIKALDLLSLQLKIQYLDFDIYNNNDIKIPLGTKASLKGKLLLNNKNKLKVNINKEWFIEMNLEETLNYIERRKKRLLEEHCLILEGNSNLEIIKKLNQIDFFQKESSSSSSTKEEIIGFHPILNNNNNSSNNDTIRIGDEKNQNELSSLINNNSINENESKDQMINIDKNIKGIEKIQSNDNEIPNLPNQPKSPHASLVDLLDDEKSNYNKRKTDNSSGDDTTLNEEGLPIHEIRETLSGETIGPPPPPSQSEIGFSSLSAEEEDDYFSVEAVARRAALRRKLFNEDTSSDEEFENETSTSKMKLEPIKVKGGIIRSKPSQSASASTNPTVQPEGLLSSDQIISSSKQERRSPSSSQNRPAKSILKPPHSPTRKKSVTFDPSLPSPPASPAIGQNSISSLNKFGFPLPLAESDDLTNEFTPNPVPVIIPTPQNKSKDEGFAGFKRGFLTSSSTRQSTSTELTVQNSSSDKNPINASALTPKKKSLFSQRLKQPEIDASAPNAHNISSSSKNTIPNLPKVSESKGTNTIKSGVIEKSPQTAVQSVVKERSGTTSIPIDGLKIIERITKSAQQKSSDTLASTSNALDSHEDFENGDNDDYDDDDDNDEDYSDYSTGEEDEYDLDEALLAREIALEYHKKQAYKSLNQNLQEEEEEQINMGNILLGLPSVSTDEQEQEGFKNTGIPMIINPKPNDLKRFIRIGKLENGNLVLAPGEENLDSDDDDDDDDDSNNNDKEERKKNRNKIKKQLMGLEISSNFDSPSKYEKNKLNEKLKRKEKQDEEWLNSLPPSLSTNQSESQSNFHFKMNEEEDIKDEIKNNDKKIIPIIPLVPESPPSIITNLLPSSSKFDITKQEKPKKISKFKAARMANNQ
ncbi:uncharacterized protein I206_104687 [Kwoniella pini CBS 10737]|uniref:DUF3835 domain-containing protein n=1 Tax=Kwoniella pini CBS 10737 TaxID=1296096 RepID=A0A1B9I7V2_9TREE|nr:uncharacterized protein I206_02225 [Kwoniella pini CBS 10737]OCF51511.1 hypothetical protein I206_02225 [Kwoniella pini CBS 10737]